MKIIIPMAGMGTRMRPQTLTTPKPLLPIAGKSVVQRLIEGLAKSVDQKIEEISFIIGDFGEETEKKLKEIAESLNVKSSLYYQKEPLGTAHAIYCAEASLKGNVIVAFADTLFKTNFKLDTSEDGIIWVKRVEKPEEFGVVTTDDKNVIVGFEEKPKKFVSDKAIIGIYYFKEGELLRNEIKYIIDKKIRVGKEYQLTTVLENMKNKKVKFKTGEVDLWLDCGNKMATLNTNAEILKLMSDWEKKERKHIIKNSVIIEPCYIGENVQITNSVIGPFVSIEKEVKILDSVISNSIIQSFSKIKNVNITETMLGNCTELFEKKNIYNLGDYSKIEND